MTKRFGPLVALDNVSIRIEPGTVHALLGENGAGKSTLVKCIMGYYRADAGAITIDGRDVRIGNPKLAHGFGLGMVYQHFTLVPSMTVAENLVLGDGELPTVINWRHYMEKLSGLMASMPFSLELGRPVSSLAAGEKQKLEILKQLYLGSRVLILDEPTSVLTPDEADEMLGLMRRMADEKQISVVLITHKLREVEAYAHDVSVLRHGKLVGQAAVKDLAHADMVRMMIGRENVSEPASREDRASEQVTLEVQGLTVNNDKGLVAVDDATLAVKAGEVVGVAGVSGNGQTELVETLAGQRQPVAGEIRVHGHTYDRTRREMRELGVFLLPEEPLNNGCVRNMSVAENLALRNFDEYPYRNGWSFVNRGAIRRNARELIKQFKVKTQGPDAPIETLSGGNVQRVVLARELSSDVRVLIVQNPCFGLDLNAVAEIRNRIMDVRNSGAAVLLISEDLDEILELADRILVIFEGRLVFETPRAKANIHEIGRHMASHTEPQPIKDHESVETGI